MERITGVLSVLFRPLGRRMSACSSTPSVDGIVACVQVASGGTSAAEATAGTDARAARTMAVAKRILMCASTHCGVDPCAARPARRITGARGGTGWVHATAEVIGGNGGAGGIRTP